MARAVAPETSAFYKAQHEGWGTRFFMDTGVAALEGTAAGVAAVVLADGRRVPADLVLIGIGVVPNVELAAEAGLEVRDGIVVDDHLATADPAISAIGDCANHPNDFACVRTKLRLESIQNATDQARCVAARLLGNPKPYRSVPWFWSDQGECKLQIVGLPPERRSAHRQGRSCGWRLFGVSLRRRHAWPRSTRSIARAITWPAANCCRGGLALTPDQVRDPTFDLKAYVMGRRTAA